MKTNNQSKTGEQLLATIHTEIINGLISIPVHGKICFELTFRDSHLQRLLTTHEVSKIYVDSTSAISNSMCVKTHEIQG
jgi:hypothetical protein